MSPFRCFLYFMLGFSTVCAILLQLALHWYL